MQTFVVTDGVRRRGIVGLVLSWLFCVLWRYIPPLMPFWRYYMVFLLICTVVYITLVIRVKVRGDVTLKLQESALELNGQVIHSSDLKWFGIDGYKRPVMGLQPRGKKIVPLNLCFRLREKDERAGMHALTVWCEDNNVDIRRKPFMRLI